MNEWIKRIISFAACLWITWALHPVIFSAAGTEWDIEKLGQWGDSFGALNALFASLAFGAGLITLRVQQKQIARDRFDSTFFELLRLMLDARNRVTFRHTESYTERDTPFDYGKYMAKMTRRPREEKPPVNFTGVDAFHQAWLEIRFWLKNTSSTESQVVKIYEEKVHNRIDNTLGPYFRILYTILKRVEQDKNLTREDRRLYGNLVRSQLSGSELAIAGLNGLSEVSKDFRGLVRNFRLLKYTTGTRRRLLENFYEDYVFEGRDFKPEKSI